MLLEELLRSKTRALRDLSGDDILGLLGLERRHTPLDNALPTTLAFAAGLAAGAGIALLLAPKSGREIRQDISQRANELSGRLTSAAGDAVESVRQALPGGEAARTPAANSGMNRGATS